MQKRTQDSVGFPFEFSRNGEGSERGEVGFFFGGKLTEDAVPASHAKLSKCLDECVDTVLTLDFTLRRRQKIARSL